MLWQNLVNFVFVKIISVKKSNDKILINIFSMLTAYLKVRKFRLFTSYVLA
jgi:hypothetical protein